MREFLWGNLRTGRNPEFIHLVGSIIPYFPNKVPYIFPSGKEEGTGWGKRAGVLL